MIEKIKKQAKTPAFLLVLVSHYFVPNAALIGARSRY